jgi:hypothetical protein
MTIYGASNTILQIKGTVFIGGYLCTIDPEELYTLPITPSQVVTYWVYIELEESEGFATAFSIKHATSFDSFPSSNKFFLGQVVVNESEITAIIGGDVATDYFIYTGSGSGEVGRNVRLYTTPTLIAVTGVDPEKKIFSIGSLYGYGFCVYQPVSPAWIYYVWSSSEAVIPAIRGFGFYIRSSEDGLRDLDASYCDFQALSIG